LTRPAIGICATEEIAEHGVWRERVGLAPAGLVEAVQQSGAVVLILSLDDHSSPDEILSQVDGVILRSWVGEATDLTPVGSEDDAGSARQQRLELALAQRAADKQLPVLGVSAESIDDAGVAPDVGAAIVSLVLRAGRAKSPVSTT
jgi:gamma-glutamyl-gamma-aminobutyrate hydrolase PuuD